MTGESETVKALPKSVLDGPPVYWQNRRRGGGGIGWNHRLRVRPYFGRQSTATNRKVRDSAAYRVFRTFGEILSLGRILALSCSRQHS
jgi:hypothetical protein